MPLAVWIVLAVAAVVVGGILYIRWSDARWYRKHPEFNDFYARLDNELTQIGE